MKGNECDVVEWRFVEWNGINREIERKNESKMMKMGEKYSVMTFSSLTTLISRLIMSRSFWIMSRRDTAS